MKGTHHLAIGGEVIIKFFGPSESPVDENFREAVRLDMSGVR